MSWSLLNFRCFIITSRCSINVLMEQMKLIPRNWWWADLWKTNLAFLDFYENYLLKSLHLYWTSAAAEITQLPQIVLSSLYYVHCTLLHNVLHEHTLAHVETWGTLAEAGKLSYGRQSSCLQPGAVSAGTQDDTFLCLQAIASGTTRVYIFNFQLCHSLPSPVLYSPFPNFSSACAYDPTVTYISNPIIQKT